MEEAESLLVVQEAIDIADDVRSLWHGLAVVLPEDAATRSSVFVCCSVAAQEKLERQSDINHPEASLRDISSVKIGTC